MKIIFSSILFLLFFLAVKGQNKIEYIEGRVSYISSQNVYVKFKTTDGILVGDTLFKKEDQIFKAVLKVNSISSISCVGEYLFSGQLNISDLLYAKISIKIEETKPSADVEEDTILAVKSNNLKSPVEKRNPKSKILGHVSAASYSSFSSENNTSFMRMRYSLALRKMNISKSKLSAETYINFSHKTAEWNEIKDNIYNGLKIYNLNLRYDFSKESYMLIGRKINFELSNVGAVDGLQVQKNFRSVNVGGFIGSRPDYSDYSFNFNMLQYGAYLAWKIDKPKNTIRNTFAFIEQRNNKEIDRRFAYLQHRSNFKKLYVFGSLEADLYKMLNGESQSTVSLTSFYFRTRYRFTPKLSLSASYDARKNVLYYETFKNLLDSIIDSEVRQGYRLRLYYRPSQKLSMGFSGGYRFRKTDPQPAYNLIAFFNYYKLPLWDLNASLTATYLQTTYMSAGIYALRLQKSLASDKLFLALNYRYLNGLYNRYEQKLIQSYVELSVDWKVYQKMYFSLNYELGINTTYNENHVYFRLSKKF
jgi:hypothetical protein